MTTETATTPAEQTTAPVEAAPSLSSLLNAEDTNTDTPENAGTGEPEVQTDPNVKEGTAPSTLPEGFETQDDLVKAFSEMKERYTAPEDYELPTVEGFTFFEDSEYGVGQFKDVAKDLGLNQEGFGKVMDFYVKAETHRAVAEQQNRENAVYEAFGGVDKASKAIPITSARVKSVLGADGMSVYQDAASGSVTAAASAIKLAGMLISKLQGEPAAPVKGAQTESLSRESLREMMRDPRYKTNPEFRAKVDAGYESLYR